jgi:hypothetical protein
MKNIMPRLKYLNPFLSEFLKGMDSFFISLLVGEASLGEEFISITHYFLLC